jgi:hypothetical protein
MTFLRALRRELRGFRHRPVLTSAAVLLLCLGIGSTTATFTFVDAILLRPFAVPEPDRVVQIWDEYPF